MKHLATNYCMIEQQFPERLFINRVSFILQRLAAKIPNHVVKYTKYCGAIVTKYFSEIKKICRNTTNEACLVHRKRFLMGIKKLARNMKKFRKLTCANKNILKKTETIGIKGTAGQWKPGGSA